MMFMPNEESELAYQVVPYIHSPACFIQRDDSGAEKKQKYLRYSENLIYQSGRRACLYFRTTIGSEVEVVAFSKLKAFID